MDPFLVFPLDHTVPGCCIPVVPYIKGSIQSMSRREQADWWYGLLWVMFGRATWFGLGERRMWDKCAGVQLVNIRVGKSAPYNFPQTPPPSFVEPCNPGSQQHFPSCCVCGRGGGFCMCPTKFFESKCYVVFTSSQAHNPMPFTIAGKQTLGTELKAYSNSQT